MNTLTAVVKQPLSYFAERAKYVLQTVTTEFLKEQSGELDKHFSGDRELGEELAGIGRVRNFHNYSKFLERNHNSLDAVRLIQEDLGNAALRIANFIDQVIILQPSKEFKDQVELSPAGGGRFSTEDRYSFAKGTDMNQETWYEMKGPDLELYKYWKQAHYDSSMWIVAGEWTDRSLVHTIDLRDPSVASKASCSQQFKYQVGNMGTERNTKLLQYQETDPQDKPSLDKVEKDPLDESRGHRFSQQLRLMYGHFYKK